LPDQAGGMQASGQRPLKWSLLPVNCSQHAMKISLLLEGTGGTALSCAEYEADRRGTRAHGLALCAKDPHEYRCLTINKGAGV
jgi:hypothetical protein